MRSGYIDASKEMLSEDGVFDALADACKIVRQEERGNGIIRLHCESESFEEAGEGCSLQYDAIMSLVDNKPKVIRFEKV